MNEYSKEIPSPDFRDPLVVELINAGANPELVAKVEKRLRDSLTGLPKADTCMVIMENFLSQGAPVTVEFDDLMFLKTYNDTIGHGRTNEMLRQIAAVFKRKEEELRSQGVNILIGRYAGDEFLKIVVGLSAEEAVRVFDEIEREFRKIGIPEGALFRPHFARGIATSAEVKDKSPFQIIDLADSRARVKKVRIRQKLERLAESGGKESPAAQFLAQVRRYG